MTTTATPLAPPERGIKHFAAQQTPWSWTALAIGILALLLPVLGPIVILAGYGWIALAGSVLVGVLAGVASAGVWYAVSRQARKK